MASSDGAIAQLQEDVDCQIEMIGQKSGLDFGEAEVDITKIKIWAEIRECYNEHSDSDTDGSGR